MQATIMQLALDHEFGQSLSDMMAAAIRPHRLSSRSGCRKTRSGSFAVDLESLARFQFRPGSPSRRLSAGFGLRLAPAKTQQKSGGHPSDRPRRQFAAPPPARKLLTLGLSQIAQDPQEPQGSRGDLDPNLNPAFGGQAVELSTGRAQLGFQESDAMFDVAVATHKKIDLVFHTQVFKLKRDMQKRSRKSASSLTFRQNAAVGVTDETPTYSPTTVCGGHAPARAAATGDQDRSRTPGDATCK